jgi:site-specific recombinase XerD
MSLDEMYDEFLNYLLSEKNASDATIITYRYDYNTFDEYLMSKCITKKINIFTTPIIRNYIAFLKLTKNYSPSTIRRKIHSLSSFFTYAHEQRYIIENPMLPIHAPKQPDRIPKFLSVNEIKLLINAPSKYTDEPFLSLRNKVIIETFLYTGIRRQELLNLDWTDLDFGEKTLLIRKGKGNKQRIVPLIEPLASELWKYLQTMLPINHTPLFISSKGNRMSVTALQQFMRRYVVLLGFDKKGYSIHTLRHTYASHLAQQNVSLIKIQRLMGHSDPGSTMIYAHLDNKNLSSDVEKLPYI